MESIRVLIVDDHAVVRDGLRFILQSSPRLQIAAEASTGIEALEAVRTTRPSVVLMDLKMPDMDGLEATRRIKEEFPQTYVVVMTMQDDEQCIADALQAGAIGYLLKNSRREEICQAVEAAARGEVIIKSALLDRALKTMLGTPRGEQPQPQEPASHPRGETLTDRERLVLRLLVEGKTNKEIGARLFISPGTVKKHVENILAKLGAEDRTGAAAIAIRTGLVE